MGKKFNQYLTRKSGYESKRHGHKPIASHPAGHRYRSRMARPNACGRVALVLQGGGALGAYQAGVYQALHEAGLEPDWISGVSIGAINAAIIAGNPPENAGWKRCANSGTRITDRTMWLLHARTATSIARVAQRLPVSF